MIPIFIGYDKRTKRRVYLEWDALRTHLHLIGATGSGKTTTIHAIARCLFLATLPKCCVFLIDPIGNLCRDLLTFIAHPTFCPDHVRRRLVYIEPAREDVVLPFNPLTYTTEGNRYYQVMRSVDLVLRAWQAQDLAQQPRLLQWMYKAFCAAAMLDLPISMCRFLLHPGTDEHRAILSRIPGDIRYHWEQILRARGGEPERILESTRNRLDPFFESVNLKRMFGSRRSRFDCERFIRERRIVLINLGKYGKIPGFTADTIGGLMLNEVLETASRLSTEHGRQVVDPTVVILDEFQKYVSVDVEDALPTVRQMGLRLILAHQSFSQLKRSETVDLTNMIWQARSRLIFANSAGDADILGDELGKLTFDPMQIKDIRTSRKQLIVGYRKEWLDNESSSGTVTRGESRQDTIGYGQGRSTARKITELFPTETTSRNDQTSRTSGQTTSDSSGESRGRSQANVPVHDTFDEVSKITFGNFEEWAIHWSQRIRHAKVGEALFCPVGNPAPQSIRVHHFPIHETPGLLDRVEALKQQNFASEFFISAAEADREDDECRRLIHQQPLRPDVALKDATAGAPPADASPDADVPFR